MSKKEKLEYPNEHGNTKKNIYEARLKIINLMIKVLKYILLVQTKIKKQALIYSI